jgi:transcriptional regulator with XRE-family HTH domain
MSSSWSTSVPFEARFAELRKARGVSLRRVAQRTKEIDTTGKGLSPSYLGALATGTQPPSSQALQLIAEALDVSPNTFVEYRLASVRAAFDERQIGVAEAARHLEIFEAGMTPTLSRALFDAS